MKRVAKTLFTAAAILSIAITVEAASTPKLQVKDGSGNTKFVVNDDGTTGIGTSSAPYPVTIDSSIASAVPAGVGMVMLQGSNGSNKERIEIRSFAADPTFSAPVIQGKGYSYDAVNNVPANTKAGQFLFMLGGSGHDGSAIVVGNKALVKIKAEADWSATSNSTQIGFETTPVGSTTKAERMLITGAGNVGIGTSAPSQKLEVNGGVRMNTATARPTTCDATTRGTIWFVQDAANQNDSLSVCALKAGVYGWQPLF